MSIREQITRIQEDRNVIRTKLTELGLATATDNLDVLAEAIDEIQNQGSVSANVKEGETYTIPKGFHDGSGTVSGIAGGGNYSLQSKAAITPTKKQQQITPDDGYYGLSDVTIGAIPDAYQDVTNVNAGEADVLANKIIVDATGKEVVGTMTNNGAVDKTLTADDPTYTVPKGYHDGTGTVKIVPEEKTATPTKSAQTISPAAGKVLKKVVVNAIPDNFVDTTDADATADNILIGKTAYVNSVKVEGAMANNGDVSGTIDGLNASTVTIPAGFTIGGTISLTSDIEEALAAI